MSYSLAVYGNDAFREFILPQLVDHDYSIVLSSEIFAFREDVAVNFENIGGVWKLIGVEGDVRVRRSGVQPGQALELGSLIHLRQDDKIVDILVMSLDQSLNRLKKYAISGSARLTVGSGDQCDIVYNLQSLVSKQHAILEFSRGACRVTDTSRNGIYMDYRRIHGDQMLRFGQQVNVFGLQIIWLGNVIAIGTTGQEVRICAPWLRELTGTAELYPNGCHQVSASAGQLFHRSPRVIPNLHADTIEIEAVPQPNRSEKRPLLLTIGPSMTMVIPMLLGSLMAIVAAGSSGGTVSPYMYTGIVIAAAAASLGVMWALINLKYSKRAEREAEENRIVRYQSYLYEIQEDIMQKAEDNRRMLESTYPSAQVCASYDAYCPALWNRNPTHSDMLFVRLGHGDVDFQCNIVAPKKKFMLYDDELADQPQLIRDSCKRLHDVPVGVDLRQHPLIGVVGDGKIQSARALARVIAVQLASSCCYTDLKMAFLGKSSTLESGRDWGFARWLPHVWAENKTIRYCAGEADERTEICFALSELLRARAERLEAGQEEEVGPHYVIFLEDMDLLAGEALLKRLLTPEPGLGITTIILASRREMLPNVCETIIRTDGNRGNVFQLSVGIEKDSEILFDALTAQEAERFARTISGIEVAELELGGSIPDAVNFFDLWGVKTLEDFNVMDNWRKNRTYESMRALIGQRAGGENWYLDIHEKHHGPHGLVAGTTGSGKSETLQTFILSLAINYSPDDVAFFLIDYKGGGMADLFSRLPHVAGQISNLSGNQVRRAMVSIKSENLRRQRLFHECGVNHIDGYTRLYKSGETKIPLPHLLIIIDEFAELKKEESEFMRELISVAQVGRSLGVHLILATQKPSGTVDDNIWSNAKFRLCLRVQDRQDSQEMLHKPDAAYITRPGRGYMQVGSDEIYEEFQSGWSGAEYDESMPEGSAHIATLRNMDGKSAIVGNHLKKQQKDRQRQRWLSQLAQLIVRGAELEGEPLVTIVADRSKFHHLAAYVYEQLREAQVDYPESNSNTQRLQTFAAAMTRRPGVWQDPETVQGLIRAVQEADGRLPEPKSMTQLNAVVNYLGRLAEENGYRCFRLWLPVLPQVLYLDQLEDGLSSRAWRVRWEQKNEDKALEAMVGLYDHPANQIQSPLSVNFSEGGNLAVCGVAGSGKTTFLQTMIYSFALKYSPEEFNCYILDYSNRSLGVFASLPHCGGVVCEDEPEKLTRCIRLFDRILQERKRILKGGSFGQYSKANGDPLPAILIVIDNYAGFREKTDGVYDPKIQSLAREGNNYGIFLAITAGGFGGGDIPNRLADNLRTSIALEMGDRFKYGDVLRSIHFDVMPEPGVRGRGIALCQGTILEFQTALALRAEDDFDRSERLTSVFTEMSRAWTGMRPVKIPEIPADPTLALLRASGEYQTALETGSSLPYGYYQEDATLCCVDLRASFCYLITGRGRTGKSTLLQVIGAACAAMGGDLCLAEFGKNRLKKAAPTLGAAYVSDTQSLFDYTKRLQTVFLERNKEKQRLLQSGAEEDEIFRAMKTKQPIFLLIDDLAGFVRGVYETDQTYPGVKAFYENAVDKGALHHIYFIAALDTAETTSLLGKKIYERMVSYQAGIHLGGNVAQQKIFDFSSMPFSEQSKLLKPGIGLLPQNLDHPNVRRVVLPKLQADKE